MSDENAVHLSENAASKLLPVSQPTLRRYRMKGQGPPYWEGPNGVIKYKKADVLAWRELYYREGGAPPGVDGSGAADEAA